MTAEPVCPVCGHPEHAAKRLCCGFLVGARKLECICRGPVETRPMRPVQQ